VFMSLSPVTLRWGQKTAKPIRHAYTSAHMLGAQPQCHIIVCGTILSGTTLSGDIQAKPVRQSINL
ncbi:hypothetical protein, partial [Staphylococcus pasteuri_A]